MNKLLKDFKLDKPLHSLFPWRHLTNSDNLEFRNLQHFIHVVSNLTQKEDDKCGISYADALKELKNKVPRLSASEQDSIRNLVRSKLHKRGLITEEVYEAFRYAEEGTVVGVDIGKYAAGEPDCVITPTRQYVDFFHELFVNISYRWDIDNSVIVANVAKLLAAIEELERQHIFIKITLVLPVRGVLRSGDRDMFLSIPLFSHKEYKSVATMSAVLNERLLRKFVFAIMEDLYGSDLISGYGKATSLSGTINIGDTLDEIQFFEEIKKKVGA